MKSKLLTTVLGLVLFAGLMQPAFANIDIDTFEDEDAVPKCDITTTVASSPDTGTDTAATGVIGDGDRTCTVTVQGGVGSATIQLMVDTGSTALNYGEGPGVVAIDGILVMLYNNGGTNDMDVDFSSISSIDIKFAFTDMNVDVTTEIKSGVDEAVPQTATPPLKTTVGGGVETISFSMAEFIAANGSIDLSDIDSIKFTLDSNLPATDFTINLLTAVEPPIGGEFIGVDTSALLLAGAEMNSYWILPLIAFIGLGAFIYSRKRN